MEEWEQMISDCEARESRLTDWERGFIDSISKQLERGASLTRNQDATLNEIWDRATSNG